MPNDAEYVPEKASILFEINLIGLFRNSFDFSVVWNKEYPTGRLYFFFLMSIYKFKSCGKFYKLLRVCDRMTHNGSLWKNLSRQTKYTYYVNSAISVWFLHKTGMQFIIGNNRPQTFFNTPGG